MSKAKYYSEFKIYMNIRRKIINMDNPTLKDIALSVDMCPSTLYKWRDGQTCEPRLSSLIKVAGVFGYEMGWTKKEVKRKLKAVK